MNESNQPSNLVPENAPPDSGALQSVESSRSGTFYVVTFGIFMLVGLTFLAWIGRPPRVSIVGEQMPRLDLTPLLATDQRFENDALEGKLTLFHFWGTWAPECKDEFEGFVDLYQRFKERDDVQIVSVVCSRGPEYDVEKLRESTGQFLDEYGVEIPTHCDTAAMTRNQIGLRLNGSFGVPTTLVVGPDGRVVKVLARFRGEGMQQLADWLANEI